MKKIITNEEIIESLSKYTDLSTLRNKDINLYQIARKRGLNSWIPKKEKKPANASKYTKYTDQEIIERLKTYDTITELREKDLSFYFLALRRGFRDEMPERKRKQKTKYTDEYLIDLINSCSTHKEFTTNYKGISAYISNCRRHLREYIDKLPRNIRTTSRANDKAIRDRFIYKKGKEKNILLDYNKICITIDDEKIYIGNWVSEETKKKLIDNGYFFIFKSI